MLLQVQIVTTMRALVPPVVRISSDQAARAARKEAARCFKHVDAAGAVRFRRPRTIMSISVALDRTTAQQRNQIVSLLAR
jgi:hypothetical protein